MWEGWKAGFLAFHAFHTLSFPWPALETHITKSQSPRRPVLGTGTTCPRWRLSWIASCRSLHHHDSRGPPREDLLHACSYLRTRTTRWRRRSRGGCHAADSSIASLHTGPSRLRKHGQKGRAAAGPVERRIRSILHQMLFQAFRDSSGWSNFEPRRGANASIHAEVPPVRLISVDQLEECVHSRHKRLCIHCGFKRSWSSRVCRTRSLVEPVPFLGLLIIIGF